MPTQHSSPGFIKISWSKQKLKLVEQKKTPKNQNWLRNCQPRSGGQRFLAEQAKDTKKCLLDSSPRSMKLAVPQLEWFSVLVRLVVWPQLVFETTVWVLSLNQWFSTFFATRPVTAKQGAISKQPPSKTRIKQMQYSCVHEICTRMGAIFLQNVGDSLVWNQYYHPVDAEVKFYKYRFPILFLEVFWKQYLITVCFILSTSKECPARLGDTYL